MTRPRFVRRRPMLILAAIAGFYAVVCAVLAVSMRTPATFSALVGRMPPQAFMLLPMQTLWTHMRAGRLSVGDAAPDFDLPRVDHEGTVRLSEFRGRRPVLLVFGSYT